MTKKEYARAVCKVQDYAAEQEVCIRKGDTVGAYQAMLCRTRIARAIAFVFAESKGFNEEAFRKECKF